MVKQTIAKQRDDLSSKIYQLYQKKHFETELINLLTREDGVYAGQITHLLDQKIHWDDIRTHTFSVKDINKNLEPHEIEISLEYEAVQHDYMCVAILDKETYVCYRRDGKKEKDKELIVIILNDGMKCFYTDKK